MAAMHAEEGIRIVLLAALLAEHHSVLIENGLNVDKSIIA
jgi:hypothetical protein